MTDREKPSNYGKWWNEVGGGPKWYEEIFEGRRASHDAFTEWIKDKELRSVLEIGCGCAVRYPELFEKQRYVAIDVSRKEIEWSRQHDQRIGHEYIIGDVLKLDPSIFGSLFDLVYAHAVIDHVYDMPAFIKRALELSRNWIYITAYRGWFPELEEHLYSWNEHDTCFYNDIAAKRVREQLESLGCRSIRVEPLATGREPIVDETLIIAQVP